MRFGAFSGSRLFFEIPVLRVAFSNLCHGFAVRVSKGDLMPPGTRRYQAVSEHICGWHISIEDRSRFIISFQDAIRMVGASDGGMT